MPVSPGEALDHVGLDDKLAIDKELNENRADQVVARRLRLVGR